MFIFSCRQCGGSLLQDRPTRALSAAVTLQQQTTAAHHNQGWLLLLLRWLHNTTRFTVTEQGGNSGCCRWSWFHIDIKWRDEGLRQPANHNKPMTSCWGFFMWNTMIFKQYPVSLDIVCQLCDDLGISIFFLFFFFKEEMLNIGSAVSETEWNY